MTTLMGCFTFVLLGAFFLLIALVGNIIRVFQTFNRSAHNSRSGHRDGTTRQSGSTSRPNSRTRRSHKGKIFEAGEGEYVDFVEIKN